ncbi:hypothetical protein CHS0354_014692 [Potamilus streckersoni]|uniref:RRM domain-containing protein n=1 Tax=Potamilus streckersoni TaxID=2493646 RepID=A0AAE0SPX5_9BIVA|nr:hypothetical protein CHS0354_014692 [Potamilus streckersoni]
MEEMEGLFGTEVDYLGLGSYGALELNTADELVLTSLMSEIFPTSIDEEIVQLQEDGLLDLDADHSGLPGINGIEAFDVNGLLEQFEEASQTFGNCDTLQPSLTFDWNQNGPENMQGKENENKPSSSNKVELTTEMIEKLKACNKRKAAVLLPMGVPAKRGRGRAMARGRAVALPASCTPLKLQRIMMQNSDVRDLNLSIVLPVDTHTSVIEESKDAMDKVVAGKEEKIQTAADEEKIQVVNENYFSQIKDHDYSKNVPIFDDSDQQEQAECCAQDGCNKESGLNGDIEEGEIVEEDETVEDGTSIKVSKGDSQKSLVKRNYRKREEPVEQDSEVYFDKLPSYYTALSIPKKPTKKYVGEAISKDDFDRDPSPTQDSSLYDKLPGYYKCFTNSTKYDSKVLSSGYSSRSHTPVRDSAHPKRSYSKSRRSRSRSRYSQERKRKRSRQLSFSSCSGSRSSSSSQSSSRSRSRSCYTSSSSSRSRSRGYSSGSRSSSGSYSRSKSRSYSRSCSRSRRKEKRGIRRRSTSRSSSREREMECQREQRHKEKEAYKKRCIEERRIIYIGRLPDDYTRRQLRKRFERFGEIEDTRVHMREHGDNYGFVTFCYTCDAYAAIEKGNSIPGEPAFDLCFGGRRQFCATHYADLDGNMEIEEEYTLPAQKSANLDFDTLLQQAKKAAKR